MCGQSIINLNEWKENTVYKGIYDVNHQIIKWFWEILANLKDDEIEKFFKFSTGSSRLPPEGFK